MGLARQDGAFMVKQLAELVPVGLVTEVALRLPVELRFRILG